MNRFLMWGMASAWAAAITPCTATTASPALDAQGCSSKTMSAALAGGSSVVVLERECKDDEIRDIKVQRHVEGKSDSTLLELRQNLNESPYGGARLFDLEQDGLPELEVTKSCGAGPNCDRDVYKLDAAQKSYKPYFSGGYSELKQLGSYLVDFSRASCCSWESHVYPATAPGRALDERDMLMLFEVQADDDGKDEVTHSACRAQARDAGSGALKPLEKIPPELLLLCEAYGKNYSLGQ